jgi:phosphonate transport system substrate-binding protein
MNSNRVTGAKFKIILFTLIVAVSLCYPVITAAQEPLKFCVHPYLPATELINKFSPLIDYLSREINQPVSIEISNSYQEHIDKVGKNAVDISYMGPASSVHMTAKYGKKPLLARLEINGKPTFQGIIITPKKNSALSALKDLTVKHFAFGDPSATMSHLVPRYVLLMAGVRVEDLAGHRFLKNHHNVALGVLTGDFDACAVKEEVFYKYEKRGLKEFVRTPKISEHVFVASNKISPKDIKALRNAMHKLSEKEEGMSILHNIKHSATGLAPVKNEDYDNLRSILNTLKKSGI